MAGLVPAIPALRFLRFRKDVYRRDEPVQENEAPAAAREAASSVVTAAWPNGVSGLQSQREFAPISAH
jgi:hypothetical protein